MLRSRVLVVDAVTDPWKNLDVPAAQGQFELQVLDDGLDAYMEYGDNEYETLLIQADLPGVSGRELARTVLDQRTDANVVLFGCDGAVEEEEQNLRPGNSSLRMTRVSSRPEDAEEASRLLEEVVGSTAPARK